VSDRCRRFPVVIIPMTVPEPVGSAADSGVPGKFEVSGQRTTPGKTGLAYSHLVGEPVHITPTGKTPENRVSGTITGILIAVDPITYSAVLVTKSEDSSAAEPRVVLLPHVVEIYPNTDSDPDPELSEAAKALIQRIKNKTAAGETTEEKLSEIKVAVKAWLESNQLAVQEDPSGELVIQGGNARLRAPYGPDDVAATNEIILTRLVDLIRHQREQLQN